MLSGNSSTLGSRHLDLHRAAFWAVRALIVLWAGFWLWFNIASAIGESTGMWHHVQVAAITTGLAVIAWFWQRIGGVLMVIAGVLAASAFPNLAALTLLALPAAAIGVLLLLVRK